jgi:hypothetical protein
MKRRISLLATAAGMVVALAVAPSAAAHNRAHIILPSGECFIVGSEKSVYPGPDKTTQLDLRPETSPADEIGTAFAAEEGNSKLEKGVCPP